MLTQEEKEQLAEAGQAIKEMTEALQVPDATEDEKAQLEGAKEALEAISDALTNTSSAPVSAPVIKPVPDLSRLVPSGNLNKLKERIAERMPVTDEQYQTIVNAAKADIRTNSRLNGLMKNVSVLAEAITKTVLPLFL